MQFLVHILVTFLMVKMMLFLPEELVTYLKDESTTHIKPTCTYMIEIILMFLMRRIAASMQKCFIVNTEKIAYFFNKEHLREPMYADTV